MDLEASYLLQVLKEEQQRTSERMHRDAKRQHVLKRASLMLGTGISADGVKDWLAAAHIVLSITKKAKIQYDGYRRLAPGDSR